MKFGVVTIFPELFSILTEFGVTGRAFRSGSISLNCFDPRLFTENRYQSVDDRPYGGGPGMVMSPIPMEKAIRAAKDKLPTAKVIHVTPQGSVFNHQSAVRLCEQSELIWLCGRYEDIDERVIQVWVDEEWSLGDFVMSGGELAAAAMMDAIIRLLPNVLGDQRSAAEDSFSAGLLDCPHFTRPENYRPDGYPDLSVPKVLLSGDHESIRRWRLKQSLGRTWLRRPELLERTALTAEQNTLLQEYIRESETIN